MPNQKGNSAKSIKMEDLKLLSFNVEGLDSMLLDPTFTDLINVHDICILVETMKKDDSKLNLEGFWDVSQVRTKTCKVGRHSGGITVLAKSHLRKGIKVAHNTEGLFWIRLFKSFFGWENDLFICGTYIPPHNTSKTILAKTDYFSDLTTTTNNFLRQGNVIIAGDLNARIGCNNNDESIDIPLINDLLPHVAAPPQVAERSNCDQVVNQHGRKLSQICTDLNLYVANGRTPGDLLGNLTCYTNNGSSTVDLVIADQQMIRNKQGLQWTPEEETMNTVILFVIDSVMKVLMEYRKCVNNE